MDTAYIYIYVFILIYICYLIYIFSLFILYIFDLSKYVFSYGDIFVKLDFQSTYFVRKEFWYMLPVLSIKGCFSCFGAPLPQPLMSSYSTKESHIMSYQVPAVTVNFRSPIQRQISSIINPRFFIYS